MMNERRLIEGCARHNGKAQHLLYDKYSAFLLGICLRYSGDRPEAEDILRECFIRIFTSIEDFKKKGSFEEWLRKVAVTTAIAHYLKIPKPTPGIDNEGFVSQETGDLNFDEDFLTAEELYGILNGLPAGNRMVFNLYAIEGFKHKEIALMLNIDSDSSRSQYNRAKLLIMEKLESSGKSDTGIADHE